MPVEARIKALRDALVAFSGKQGVNAQTIAMLGEQFASAVTKRWDHICDVALSEDSGGKVDVVFKTSLDLSGQAPTGQSTLTFTQVMRDDWNFAVARSTNQEVTFEEAIGRRATQFPPAPPAPALPVAAPTPSQAATAREIAAINEAAHGVAISEVQFYQQMLAENERQLATLPNPPTTAAQRTERRTVQQRIRRCTARLAQLLPL